MPTQLPHPHPPPHARVAALTKALVKECDGARSAVARLKSKLAAEREAKLVVKARAEAIR